jgi:hypothetical protein
VALSGQTGQQIAPHTVDLGVEISVPGREGQRQGFVRRVQPILDVPGTAVKLGQERQEVHDADDGARLARRAVARWRRPAEARP